MACKKVRKTNRQWKGSRWIQPWRRLAIYMRDSFACQYCGRNLLGAKKEDVTLDHLRCHTNKGGDESTNLVTACRSCNSSRQDKPWRRYATGGAIQRIAKTRYRKLNEQLAKAIIKGTAGDPRLECK
jgi:5-methylcytosine-specific restriction endonuclease McrA